MSKMKEHYNALIVELTNIAEESYPVVEIPKKDLMWITQAVDVDDELTDYVHAKDIMSSRRFSEYSKAEEIKPLVVVVINGRHVIVSGISDYLYSLQHPGDNVKVRILDTTFYFNYLNRTK